MEHKVNHFLYTPFTGLGLYGGHRGKRWLKNRIKIFKQFVLPSLLAQTSKDFILWISWRYEDRGDPIISAFREELEKHLKVVFTYSGVCFWDDKYPDEVARERLIDAIHGSMGDLLNVMNDSDTVLMTIQPSDDCYHKYMVEQVQNILRSEGSTEPDLQAVGYRKGYVMDYVNRRLCEWNPTTTPPFYTIKFTKETFGMHHPLKHLEYTGPYKSHEYVKDNLKTLYLDDRGFVVGTHGENISTIFNHPFTGHEYLGDNIEAILDDFGLKFVAPLEIRMGIRKWLMRKLPHGWQRKLRYLLGQRFYSKIYDFLRS